MLKIYLFLTNLTNKRSNIHLPFIYVNIISIILCLNINATVRSFETTRLKSTAGAGVASLLMDEATLLNPAPLAFFNISAIYYQHVSLTPKFYETPPTDIKDSDQTAFIVSDASGNMKGSLSYLDYNEGFENRKRFSASLASNLGPRSAMGITFRHTKDKELKSSDSIETIERAYKQLIIGIIHAINQNLTMGIVVVDPLNVNPIDRISLLGIQYVFDSFISIMVDFGVDYKEDIAKSNLYKAAIQFRLLGDFYLRLGTYKNNKLKESGSGIGLGWIQPKLVLEFAIKNNHFELGQDKLSLLKEVKETSFSVSYRF